MVPAIVLAPNLAYLELQSLALAFLVALMLQDRYLLGGRSCLD